MRNNGFDGADDGDDDHGHGHGRGTMTATTTVDNPIPNVAGVASRQIKHVIFINKENATHDLLLGDITATRRGRAGRRRARLLAGAGRQPQPPRAGAALHVRRQLLPRADGFVGRPPLADQHLHDRARGDALAGLLRRPDATTRATTPRSSRTIRDASASPTRTPRPSRTTTTSTAASTRTWSATGSTSSTSATASSSRWSTRTARPSRPASASTPTCRWRRSSATTPTTCIPEFNTHIPDAPLPENPDRFNRFGRFKQVFEAHYVDRGARQLQAAELRRSLLPERPRRRRQRHQPERAGLGLHALRAGQRRGAGADRRAHLEEPVLEGHRHLRRRGRHPERPRPRRRLPVAVPGHPPVGEAGERHQDAHQPGVDLQDGGSHPRDRRRSTSTTRRPPTCATSSRASPTSRPTTSCSRPTSPRRRRAGRA